MPILFLAVLLCSCSHKAQQSNGLQNYSDMGAAEDAGHTPSQP